MDDERQNVLAAMVTQQSHANPDQIVIGSLSGLPALLSRLESARALLVLDRGAAKATAADMLLPELIGDRLAGIFDEFSPNPACEQPLAAARRAASLGADTFIAFGGGSAMDVAKVGSLAAGSPERAEELVRGGPGGGVRPFTIIAIPTTSGTGSETTHFSAIYVNGHKVSVAHPGMRPRGVILDPVLHYSMPRPVAAATGLDALCQATESLWSVGGTDESRAFAADAQRLIVANLIPSVLTADPGAREAMMHGAHLAGRAINVSKTTASHALSYEMTVRFGVPHGHAVALTLGHVAMFNSAVSEDDCCVPEGSAAARARVFEACRAFGCPPAAMPARVRDILSTLGMPATLSAAGVSRDSLVPMADTADTVRLSNNPRRLTPQDALAILEAAF